MNRRVLAAFAAVIFLIALPHFAPAAEPRMVTSVEGITEYQLDNGLAVLLFPEPSNPKVTVNMTILVGSRHEGYGETGMAHLLEHMLFKGSTKFPDVPKVLRERGAEANGTTWLDRTNYYETLPATDDNLEFAISFEADRLVNSFIRREDLISEMTVVRNEFESGENDPEALLSKRLLATAYHWHNYGKPTIGNRSDIERVPIENLQAFYKKYYQPDNVVLIIAGKFDEAKALAWVQQYFGPIPRPERKLPTTYTEEPPQDGERVVHLRRVGDLALVEPVYHIPSGSHPDFAPLQILADILEAQPSGRLYKALVETKLAASVSSSVYSLHDPGLFDITVRVRREGSLDEAEKVMLQVVDDVIAKGVTDEEVQRAKQEFLNNRRRQAVNTSRLAITLSDWAALGDWRLYFLHRDRMEQVTAADVQRVAKTYLQASNRTMGYFYPTDKPELVVVPSTPDVAAMVADYKGRPPIAAAEDFDFSYPHMESRTARSKLPGGIKVAVLPKKSRDEEINLSLTLRFGNAENLKPVRDAAALLPSLMLRGTRTLPYEKFKDELIRIESELRQASGGPGSVTFLLRTKRPHLAAALDLLRQALREPALDAAQFEVLRQEELAAAEEARTNPQRRASEALNRTLSPYPPDDVRYVRTSEERIERLKAVTLEQVRQVHSDYVGATDGELVIVGDFDAEPTLKTIAAFLDGWQAKMPVARVERQAFVNVQGGRQAVATPDKANAIYLSGISFALSDRDPDYPALLLGTLVLGGDTFASRLGNRVREKEGLSYGIGCWLDASTEDKAADLKTYAICNPVNMAKVEAAVREEVERLLKNGIQDDELNQVKQGWLQEQELARSTDAGIAQLLRRSLRANQTLAYNAELAAKVGALKPADVLAALKKYVDPRRLVIVVAGDFSPAAGN